MQFHRHPLKFVDRMEYQDSTGNLNRHIKACDPDDTPEAEMITTYASGVTYSPARLRFLIAMWVAHRHRPFLMVEDPEFWEILRMLYPKVQLPSRVTVSRDVQDIFERTRSRLKDLLKVCAVSPFQCVHTLTLLMNTVTPGPHSRLHRWLDVAERHYGAAIDELFSSEGIFEATASWSPRWEQARLLCDALAIRTLRCQLWVLQTTGAVQSWVNYKDRMKDLVDRRAMPPFGIVCGFEGHGWVLRLSARNAGRAVCERRAPAKSSGARSFAFY